MGHDLNYSKMAFWGSWTHRVGVVVGGRRQAGVRRSILCRRDVQRCEVDERGVGCGAKRPLLVDIGCIARLGKDVQDLAILPGLGLALVAVAPPPAGLRPSRQAEIVLLVDDLGALLRPLLQRRHV